MFAVKAPRVATYVNDPEKARGSIERFLGSGLDALGPALGPILWQFAPTRSFEAERLETFLAMLPTALGGLRLRHAIELRHPTARDPALASLLARHNVALATVVRPGEAPVVAATADFAYLRLEGTEDAEPAGYAPDAIRRWAADLKTLAAGRIPAAFRAHLIGTPPKPRPTEVFAYVISGAKHRNPAAARALIAAL